MIHYLETLQSKFVLVLINKAPNNVAIKNILLREIDVIRDGNHAYGKAGKCCEEKIADNNDCTEQLGFKMREKENNLHTSMY